MAIDLEDEYGGNVNPADANYPQGSFKNDAVPGDLSGSPLEKLWCNDLFGLLQKLLDYAGITPSGVPDTVLASDYWDALEKRVTALYPYLVDTGAANAYVVTPDPAYTAYFDGMRIDVKITNTNTAGVSTLNVNSLGVKSILVYGFNPRANELLSGQIISLIYNVSGGNFQLLSGSHGTVAKTSLLLRGATPSPPDANVLYGENIVKGWINFNGTGTIAIRNSFNVSSIIDNGTGDYSVVWDQDFSSADYAAAGMSGSETNTFINLAAIATTGLQINVSDDAGALTDTTQVHVIAIGDQS